MSKAVYISGPMSAFEDLNKDAFNTAERLLTDSGYDVWNPQSIVGLYESREAYLRHDLRMLLDCDAIYMLCGWEASKGAQLEHRVAVECGIEVLYEPEVQ